MTNDEINTLISIAQARGYAAEQWRGVVVLLIPETKQFYSINTELPMDSAIYELQKLPCQTTN